jgi:broad specificity phosphatase PhoE
MSLSQHFARNIFPTLYGRQDSFPGGESKEDVCVRAKKFLEDVIMPCVWAEEHPDEEHSEEERSSDDSDVLPVAERKAKNEKKRAHICIVSHGLFIPELIVLMALMDDEYKSKTQEVRNNVRGMRNTDWTRVEFGFEVSSALGRVACVPSR